MSSSPFLSLSAYADRPLETGWIHIHLESSGGFGHQAHLLFIRLGTTTLIEVKWG